MKIAFLETNQIIDQLALDRYQSFIEYHIILDTPKILIVAIIFNRKPLEALAKALKNRLYHRLGNLKVDATIPYPDVHLVLLKASKWSQYHFQLPLPSPDP